MKTQPITKKQQQILNYLYQFRFLNTHQIQTLLGHKNANRSLAWLKDLIDKHYVKRHYERKSFVDNTNPAIYFLGPKARHFINKEKEIQLAELEYIYSEHRRGKKFINHCLFLADVYLFLLTQKEHTEELNFFTKNLLRGYDYFPDPVPDAFVAINGAKSTRRYFLDLFDDFTPPFALRNRVRMYISYAEKPDWDENTDFTTLPAILFICANESIKKHIYMYAKSILEKTYDDKISLYLTTKAKITAKENDIWEKVEI